MTGWHIRPGYSSHTQPDDVDAALREVIAATRVDTEALIGEAGTAGFDPLVRDCLEHYRDCQDATIKEIDEEGRPHFMLLASGGGESRDAKETARRIFVRVVMRRMHGRDLDITLVVA